VSSGVTLALVDREELSMRTLSDWDVMPGDRLRMLMAESGVDA